MSAQNSDPEILHSLLDGVQVAMLTTRRNAHLRSRPMAVLPGHFDEQIWFMTSKSSDKVSEVQIDPTVNLMYADPSSDKFVSVCGRAEVVRDSGKIEQMWDPMAKVWFTGPEDPEIVLLRVSIVGAEYWNAPSGTMISMFNFLDLPFTGEVADLGETRQLKLTDNQYTSAEVAARGMGTSPNQ